MIVITILVYTQDEQFICSQSSLLFSFSPTCFDTNIKSPNYTYPLHHERPRNVRGGSRVMDHQETVNRQEEWVNEVVSPGLLFNCETDRVGCPC